MTRRTIKSLDSVGPFIIAPDLSIVVNETITFMGAIFVMACVQYQSIYPDIVIDINFKIFISAVTVTKSAKM